MSIGRGKYISAGSVEDLFKKDLRLQINSIDLEVLFNYFMYNHDPNKFAFNKFIPKLQDKMKDMEDTPPPKLVKHASSFQVSEAEISKILRALGIELENKKVDLKRKIKDVSPDGKLTESEFEKAIEDLRLNLTVKDVTALTQKYYSTVHKLIYTDELLKDLDKYTEIAREGSSKKVIGRESTKMEKISRRIKHNGDDDKVIKEMFNMDKYYDGVLYIKDIDDAFRRAGVKLTKDDVNDLLLEIKEDRKGRFDYITLLISMFGFTDTIRRYERRVKEKTKNRDYHSKHKKEYDSYIEGKFPFLVFTLFILHFRYAL